MTEWERGIQAFRQGRLREAADRLRAAAADGERTVTQTTRFSTLAHLGAALYALGLAAEAVQTFEDALRLAPPPAPPAALRVNLANAYLAAGRPDDARIALQDALQDAPGHLEAQTLLNRLQQRDPNAPLTGGTLGENPAGVLRYLRTLSFGTVTTGGYDPAQVRLALAQIERHIEFLVQQVAAREETVTELNAQMGAERDLRERERAAAATAVAAPAPPPADPNAPPLTPLEALLRQKPRTS